ncbi:polysaccharide pyruvyl transferase family protein [Clostridium beijerinckii]|nr:polysaccharide pyruvyl transferase family protein [Clostridium beijerinckii]
MVRGDIMKVSVITMHSIRNYGSVLQTYATQENLKALGLEVEFVDYYRKDSINPKASVEDNLAVNSKWNKNFITREVFRAIKTPIHRKQFQVFGSFLSKYIKLTPKKYYSNEEIKQELPIADCYCTGSDQLWNSTYNRGIEESYFLDYVPEGSKCFSYSTSIGKERLNKKESKEIYKRLLKFSHLSVREESAKEILLELGFKDCVHVLDPTFMLSIEKWKKIMAPRIISEKYVLIYQLNKNKTFDLYAEKFAEKHGLKLYRIDTTRERIISPGKSIYLPSVEEFISLFYYSEYIITDSFHGTAFCISFAKNFSVIYPEKFSTRLESILKLTNLENRVVSDWNDYDVYNNPIDYVPVNRVINEEREKTNLFVENVLSSLKS